MLFRDTVKFAHMPFGLVPKILDTIDMIFLISQKLRMMDAKMAESLVVPP